MNLSITRLLAATALALAPTLAAAQSAPNWSFGTVPTPGQWAAAFKSKQDFLNFRPVNSAGDTMQGRLVAVPSTAAFAGFSLGQGVAPTNPLNGDFWLTSTGLFYRSNNATIAVAYAGGALGKPSSIDLTNAVNLPLMTGVIGVLPTANGGTGGTGGTGLRVGAGASADTFIIPGSGVAAALAINIGSAGAPVLFNGAGGTPSSLVLSAATGLPLTTGVTGTLPVANGGTGSATLTSGAPLFGNGTGALTAGTVSGTTTEVATVSGSLTNGHCVSVGAGGNFIDAGGACTVGGGGGTVSSGLLGQLAYYTGAGTVVGGTTTGTGVLTALGVNTGSAGAFVVNGGALGTPSGGVATNLTGTASGLTAGNVTTNANMTGDITSSGSNATTLATVNANVGSFGSSTSIPSFTVNAKGLITAASSASVAPPLSSITGLGAGIQTALGIATGSAGAPVLFNGAGGTPSSITLTNASGLPTTALTGILQAAQQPAHTGDVTNTAGSLAMTISAGAVSGSKMASGAAVANLGFTPLNPANNLSDVAVVATARANLGLTALATTAPGTGVATALGVAIGSTGAPVLFNGAGGTPSSISLLNATNLPNSALAVGAAVANLGFTPLNAASNLSDVGAVSTARTNLGLTTLATTTPGTGVATALGLTPSGTGGLVLASGATITNPGLVGDTLSVNPSAREQGAYISFFAPYFAGVDGANPSGSFGFELNAYGKVNGTGALTLAAGINPGASICVTTSGCTGDIDFYVWNGNTGASEFYSLVGGTATNPGGLIPDVTNRNFLGQANNTWKWVYADAYYVQDATLPLIQLNSTTANQGQEILFQNAGASTFAIIGGYSGGNYWSVYDSAKGGNIVYAAANAGMTVSPHGALTLSPTTGGVVINGAFIPQVSQTLASVNFNSANTDNPISMSCPTNFTRYSVNSVRVDGASGSLTTSTAGLFTAASGGGTAIVTNASVGVSTGADGTAGNAVALTQAVVSGTTFSISGFPTLYFRIGTPQGVTATANVSILFICLP